MLSENLWLAHSITKCLKLNNISGCQLKQILLNFVTMKASRHMKEVWVRQNTTELGSVIYWFCDDMFRP